MPKDDKKKDDKKTVLERWLKKNRSDFSQVDIDEIKESLNLTDTLKVKQDLKRKKYEHRPNPIPA